MSPVENSLGPEQLKSIADRGRWLVLTTVSGVKAGHVGGPLSAMDVLVSLFFNRMRIDPSNPGLPDRDRFILSKGHAAIGLYAVMAMRGYFPEIELATFDKGDSRLQGHPDPTKLPGIETATGSLGQGLSVGVGIALGTRMQGETFRTWVMLGDGELQEGMVWEAVHVAARYGLGNLTAIVDLNGLQQYGWPPSDDGPHDRGRPWAGFDVRAMFEAFGWRVREFDGHDFLAIDEALRFAQSIAPADGPTALIANTVKGKGLSFAENRYTWHTGVASEAELDQARLELAINKEG